jgi:hypothetical protein
MTQGVRKPLTPRVRVVILYGWAFVVTGGVYELIAHPQGIVGLHGFVTLLGIATGCMWIVEAVKDILEEPQ